MVDNPVTHIPHAKGSQRKTIQGISTVKYIARDKYYFLARRTLEHLTQVGHWHHGEYSSNQRRTQRLQTQIMYFELLELPLAPTLCVPFSYWPLKVALLIGMCYTISISFLKGYPPQCFQF